MILIEIFWTDLTPEAKERIVGQLESGNIDIEHNWDVFPMAMLVLDVIDE